MLVYVSRLWFTPSTGFDEPLDVVARWLSRKTGRQVSDDMLRRGDRIQLPAGQEVTSLAALEDLPHLMSVTYNHPDRQVRGRLWTTEIGLRQGAPGADIECTTLLKTSEISARVASPVQVSRPGLVTELARRCPLSNATQGVRIHRLDADSAEAFRHLVFDKARLHAYIVLSPDRDGRYLADADHLQSLLLGLADVVVIPEGVDTLWLARVVGTDFIPYHGAARLIYPEARSSHRAYVAGKLFTVQDVADLKASGTSFDTEILSLVVHRSNLPLSWAHIGPDQVRDAQLVRELRAKRAEAAKTGDLSEYAGLLETTVTELESTLKTRDQSIEELERLVQAQDDLERELRYDNEALKANLEKASKAGRPGNVAGDDAEDLVAMLPDFIDGNPTPFQSLAMLEHFMPTHIHVLREAWESAKESDRFKYGGRLFALLLLLGRDYWDALVAGKPDAEAKKMFGNSFAAKESERVEMNHAARTRRTFSYGGKDYEMMKHLKIGVKDSPAETIRVHFEWIAGEKLIVIGHCGPHIPFK